MSMNLKKELRLTPVITSKEIKTPPLKEDFVNIKMIGAVSIMSQPEKNQYFSISIKQIEELLNWHKQHSDFTEFISIMVEPESPLTEEELKKRLSPEI